ncbi:hypothetical protein [Gordonia sp. (in: high G+C Gram-positive bacteria)]|uniref:hypothetical protein n=1 Tax=Gordonia sp. (in: high G+C Gram-positive bacteria) TaxID=84139 RepID=UPI0039E3BAB8
MNSNKYAAALSAVAIAAGLAVAAAPAAEAKGIATFSSRNGQLVAYARYMRPGPKSCVFQRRVKPELDGPMSGSIDGGTVSLASRRTNGTIMALSSRRLPRGWYDVSLSCSNDPTDGYMTSEISQGGRVYNR